MDDLVGSCLVLKKNLNNWSSSVGIIHEWKNKTMMFQTTEQVNNMDFWAMVGIFLEYIAGYSWINRYFQHPSLSMFMDIGQDVNGYFLLCQLSWGRQQKSSSRHGWPWLSNETTNWFGGSRIYETHWIIPQICSPWCWNIYLHRNPKNHPVM